jgi:DNA replication and repair protein RecF
VDLKNFACQDFRNLEHVAIEPHPRFNILEGRNGQGKTNILEAIGLLGSFKSFRDAKNKELVRFGAERAQITAKVERSGVAREISVETEGKGKRVRIDGKTLSRRSEYLGHVSIVFFGPDHLALTKEGPANRRRFLDRAVFNLWPVYFEESRRYQSALKNRNKLLRDAHGASIDPDMMRSFDTEFIRSGSRLIWRRKNFLKLYSGIFSECLAQLSSDELQGTVEYGTESEFRSVESEEELCDAFSQALIRSSSSDRQRRYTTVGPHTHDVVCTLNEKSTRAFASQGQHRAFVLALKIAEIQLINAQLGFFPILLLDDVSSELDKGRNEDLMRYLNTAGSQIFITTTDKRWIQLGDNQRVFNVDGGVVH